MSDYDRAIQRMRIGAVEGTTSTALNVIREQARLARFSSENDRSKRYFGYQRFVTTEGDDEGVLRTNSDNESAMQAMVAKAATDPSIIWAGYFDNITGKLVKESTKTPTGKSSKKWWIVGGLAAAIGGVFAFKRKG